MALTDELRRRKRSGCAGRVGAIKDKSHLRIPVTEALGIVGWNDHRRARVASRYQGFDFRLRLHIVGNTEVVRSPVGIQQCA